VATVMTHAVVTAVVTAVMPPRHGGRRGVGVLRRRREGGHEAEQHREDQRECKFLHRVGFSFSGIDGQLNFDFAAGPPANLARQRLVSLLTRRRSQRTCHSSAPPALRFSPLFSHARAAPRPLHCGICARRLKIATEEKAKVKRQKAKVKAGERMKR
jgi:hypothetical protein